MDLECFFEATINMLKSRLVKKATVRLQLHVKIKSISVTVVVVKTTPCTNLPCRRHRIMQIFQEFILVENHQQDRFKRQIND